MKVPYRCLYNHELLILATSQTPYTTYDEPLGDAQVVGLVSELLGTGVDALMICPQAWQTNLWDSAIDRRWKDHAPTEHVPLPESYTKYYQRAYYRLRRYMLEGKDPVGLTIKIARESGIAPFLSYRMNEDHFTNDSDASTHSKFWKDHQQFMLDSNGSNLNYLEAEVREYYRDILFELLDRYDVDGIECDFMRHPKYFPVSRIEDGKEVMNEFVQGIRTRLDELGKTRGKFLHFSVRVPRCPSQAEEIGLDVRKWIKEGTIDMVNASSFFRMSQEIDIEGYRAISEDFSLYGEMNFVTQHGETPDGYSNNIHRRTSPEFYRSTALSFLERGADGVSLFNFAYTRDHSFREARRKYFPGFEPPFEVIADLTSKERLRDCSQLIVLTPGFGTLPVSIMGKHNATFRVHVGDCFQREFAGALFRIESEAALISHLPIDIEISGTKLAPIVFSGEFFPPLSAEALPHQQQLCYYVFDPLLLQPGYNEITVHNRWVTLFSHESVISITRLEIALYRTLSDELKAHLAKALDKTNS